MAVPSASSTLDSIERAEDLDEAAELFGLVTPALDNTLQEKHRQLDVIWSGITRCVCELEIVSHEVWQRAW